MRVSTKRILSIGVAAILLIAALVVYTTLIKPESETINKKRAIVISKSDLFNNQKRAVDQVKKLIAEFQNVDRIKEVVDLAMPEREETVRALRQIESMAALAGVTVTGLDFKTSLPRISDQPFIKKLGTLEVTMTLVGDYANLKQFLRYLETGVRLANVADLKFSPAGQRAALDTLNLKVNVYYQK